MLLRRVISQRWLKHGSLVQKFLVAPLYGNPKQQSQNRSQGVCRTPHLLFSPLKAMLHSRLHVMESGRTVQDYRLPHSGFQVPEANTLPGWHGCAHADGHTTGLVLEMVLVVHGIQSIGCKNVLKSGTWQHLLPLTENSTTGLFRFVTIYLAVKAETAVHGCLISTRVICCAHAYGEATSRCRCKLCKPYV